MRKGRGVPGRWRGNDAASAFRVALWTARGGSEIKRPSRGQVAYSPALVSAKHGMFAGIDRVLGGNRLALAMALGTWQLGGQLEDPGKGVRSLDVAALGEHHPCQLPRRPR